jgi:hypothetical protein
MLLQDEALNYLFLSYSVDAIEYVTWLDMA